jgi:hypothetical protein
MVTKTQGQRIKTVDAAGNPNLAGAGAGAFGKNSKGEWFVLHPVSGLPAAFKLLTHEPIIEHPDGNISTTFPFTAVDGIGSVFVGTIQRGVWVTST